VRPKSNYINRILNRGIQKPTEPNQVGESFLILAFRPTKKFQLSRGYLTGQAKSNLEDAARNQTPSMENRQSYEKRSAQLDSYSSFSKEMENY
jgi:hypothetical protein